MFEIAKQQVKLIKCTPLIENHGKDCVPACDLTIEAALTNDHLIHFHPELRQMLYRKAEAADGADLATDPEGLTALKFPKMSPFTWEWEGAGYTLTVDYGLGDKSDIVLGDCKIGGIEFQPIQGGTVVTKFHIVGHPNELDTGRLCAKQKQNIDITLTPPEAVTAQDLFKNKEAA